MGAIGTPEYLAPTEAGTEPERRELEWLLTSGVLGRSSNLLRVLKYICEECFAGRGNQIKEYSIATEALGRRSDFDPNSDTIVRVTVHSLRKRLLEVYQNEGAHRSMRLMLPPGHYAPRFVLAADPVEPGSLPPAHDAEPVQSEAPSSVALEKVEAVSAGPVHPRRRLWARAVAGVCVLSVVASGFWWVRTQQNKVQPLEFASVAGPLPPAQATIRALMGSHRQPYVDHSGFHWATGNYCQGGSDVIVPAQKIAGTLDAPLYLGGVRGIAHCVFPVTQKLYELHFHFAETSDLPAATRLATVSINAGSAMNVDVVDDAGGDGIATSKVVTGVAPENDGAIHVDYTSEVSLLNAVEILPASAMSQLPVRIAVNSKPYVDSIGQVWESDRYFSGGRFGLRPDSARKAGTGLYESERIGRFRYSIPAVPSAKYRVRLYFREPWFGEENGGIGGPGSRVFDVACNGEMLLKNFDILATGGAASVVKTFDHVQASAGGRIELSFIPVVNYAVVNAIEILPEN